MHYGERWRTQRRVLHQKFNSGTVGEYQPIQLKHTRYISPFRPFELRIE
jgi:cytochrome P450